MIAANLAPESDNVVVAKTMKSMYESFVDIIDQKKTAYEKMAKIYKFSAQTAVTPLQWCKATKNAKTYEEIAQQMEEEFQRIAAKVLELQDIIDE